MLFESKPRYVTIQYRNSLHLINKTEYEGALI